MGIQTITYTNKKISGTKMKRSAHYLILTVYAIKPQLSSDIITRGIRNV